MLEHFNEISNRIRYRFKGENTLFVSAGQGDSDVRETIDNVDVSNGLIRESVGAW